MCYVIKEPKKKIQSIPGEWWESCQDSADQMAPQWVFHKKYEFYEEQKETSVAFSHLYLQYLLIYRDH